METESITARLPHTNGIRSKQFSSFTFDIPTLIEHMKQSHTWVEGELVTMILLRDPGKQILLTAIHKGTEIDSFQSKGSINIKIIEGKLEFHSGKEDVVLNEGQFYTLYDKINYTLRIMEETVFLLTIATGTLILEKN